MSSRRRGWEPVPIRSTAQFPPHLTSMRSMPHGCPVQRIRVEIVTSSYDKRACSPLPTGERAVRHDLRAPCRDWPLARRREQVMANRVRGTRPMQQPPRPSRLRTCSGRSITGADWAAAALPQGPRNSTARSPLPRGERGARDRFESERRTKFLGCRSIILYVFPSELNRTAVRHGFAMTAHSEQDPAPHVRRPPPTAPAWRRRGCARPWSSARWTAAASDVP